MLTVLIISLTFPGFALGYQKSDKKSKSKGNASEYSVGQEVEVDYYNKWRPGVVVALPNSGRTRREQENQGLLRSR